MSRKLTSHQRLALLVFIVAILVRLIPILTQQVFFHFDSARDWLWVRNLVLMKKLVLIGPWSSLQGVFYGPLTYYLLVPFFVIFAGHPIGGGVYALSVNIAALILLYLFLKRNFSKKTALIGLVFLSFSLISLNTSTFIFQSNPSLILGVLALWPLVNLSRGSTKSLHWLLLITGFRGTHKSFLDPVYPALLYIISSIFKAKTYEKNHIKVFRFFYYSPSAPASIRI